MCSNEPGLLSWHNAKVGLIIAGSHYKHTHGERQDIQPQQDASIKLQMKPAHIPDILSSYSRTGSPLGRFRVIAKGSNSTRIQTEFPTVVIEQPPCDSSDLSLPVGLAILWK